MLFLWILLPSNRLRRVVGLWEGRAGQSDTPYEAGSSSVPLLMQWPSDPCFFPLQEMERFWTEQNVNTLLGISIMWVGLCPLLSAHV